MNVTELLLFTGPLYGCVSIKTVNNQTLVFLLMSSQSLQRRFTFCLYRMLHEIYSSKQTCLIDLEQTGRLRVYFIVKHVDAF